MDFSSPGRPLNTKGTDFYEEVFYHHTETDGDGCHHRRRANHSLCGSVRQRICREVYPLCRHCGRIYHRHVARVQKTEITENACADSGYQCKRQRGSEGITKISCNQIATDRTSDGGLVCRCFQCYGSPDGMDVRPAALAEFSSSLTGCSHNASSCQIN